MRRFLPQPVPLDLVYRLVEMGTFAPSAHNRQPWRFAIITTPAQKEALAAAMAVPFAADLAASGFPADQIQAQINRSHQRITEAPVIVLFCLVMSVMDVYPDPIRQACEHTMAVQSVALAAGSILLAAHAEGLGGVWVCAPLFAPEAVRQCFGLSPDWEPQGMLFLGYPAKIPPPRERQPVQEVVRLI